MRPLAVFQHLALDRHDVREHVAVRDHDALRIGRGARREDDLRDIVAADGHWGRRAVGPLQFVQPPDGRAAGVANGGTSCAEEHQLRRDDAGDARQKVRGRSVVDRDDDDAAQQTTPERDDPLGPVFAEEDDLVAVTDPARPRAARQSLARRRRPRSYVNVRLLNPSS